MKSETASLRDKVYEIMRRLPEDRVTTYGDVAAWCQRPRAARIVGVIAHGGPADLPWHRLVNARGGVAVGFPDGKEAQVQLLRQDGIMCDELGIIINFEEYRWRPCKNPLL